jgi:aspartokinase
LTTRITPKLALVAETRLTPDLCEYALKVAVRLDLEIIVLFVGKRHGDHAITTRELEQAVEEEAAAFTARAWKESIRVTTVVDSADQETALQRLRQGNPDICFVLTGAGVDAANSQEQENRHQLTVIRQ